MLMSVAPVKRTHTHGLPGSVRRNRYMMTGEVFVKIRQSRPISGQAAKRLSDNNNRPSQGPTQSPCPTSGVPELDTEINTQRQLTLSLGLWLRLECSLDSLSIVSTDHQIDRGLSVSLRLYEMCHVLVIV